MNKIGRLFSLLLIDCPFQLTRKHFCRFGSSKLATEIAFECEILCNAVVVIKQP